MGMGPTTTTSALPTAPTTLPDSTSMQVQQMRRAALRSLSARRGLSSTFLQPTQMSPTAQTLLGPTQGK